MYFDLTAKKDGNYMHLKMFLDLKSLSFIIRCLKSTKPMCQVSPTEFYQATSYSVSLAMGMIPERHLALIIQALETEEKFRLPSAYINQMICGLLH